MDKFRELINELEKVVAKLNKRISKTEEERDNYLKSNIALEERKKSLENELSQKNDTLDYVHSYEGKNVSIEIIKEVFSSLKDALKKNMAVKIVLGIAIGLFFISFYTGVLFAFWLLMALLFILIASIHEEKTTLKSIKIPQLVSEIVELENELQVLTLEIKRNKENASKASKSIKNLEQELELYKKQIREIESLREQAIAKSLPSLDEEFIKLGLSLDIKRAKKRK